MNKKFFKYIDYMLAALGGILILDSLVLHYIIFDYGTISLTWIDPWFNHWMIGAILIVVAYWDYTTLKK